MSRALLARGCYGVAMETRWREKWFMMDADGWSTPEGKVKMRVNVCTCVYLGHAL